MTGAAALAAGRGRLDAWLGGYAPEPGRPDLMLDAAGRPRAPWLDLLSRLAGHSDAEIDHRFAAADRQIRDTGISYRVHGHADDQAWPLGTLPLVLDAATWHGIAEGVAQRADLIDRVLADVYGEGRLVRDGALPAALVAASPEFLPALHGVRPRDGRHLHLYAADLGLAPDGTWRVLADRTQAPSGAGYTLNNRLVLARAFPDLYTGMNVERLAPFFQAFRAGLAAAAERVDPRICILSSGPYSQTYVEQAYLARYLGFLLVEGDDLVVRDGRLHVRTVAGLKRADVLWRRIDSAYVDPLALDPRSHLGVPGLVEVLRGGRVAVGNMPGSGLAESPALAAYLPYLCPRLLGESLRLPGVETLWCGDPVVAEAVLARRGDLAILPAYAAAGREAPDDATLRDRPGDYVGQARLRHGTAPVWVNGRLEPRPFVLRVYAAATPEGWQVMPGAFCRVALGPDADPLDMSAGVESADLWIVADGPVAKTTLLPSNEEVRVRRLAGHLPSRAADNLFWLGRYLERAEAVIPVVRCLLAGNEVVDLADRGTARRLRATLKGWCAIEAGEPGSTALARRCLHDPDLRGAAARHVRFARGVASSVRERLSGETFHALAELDAVLAAPAGPNAAAAPPTDADLLRTSEAALVLLAALSGLVGENMNRAAGWRFLDIGRRLERAINTCGFAKTFAAADATADDLDALLELIDSQISYGARYILGVSLAPVRDMALLDPYNPRSVAFQVEAVAAHLSALPALVLDGVPEPQRRLATKLSAELAANDPAAFDPEAVGGLAEALADLADAIGSRYFPGGHDARRPEPLTGLA